jgi:hypothetical protein
MNGTERRRAIAYDTWERDPSDWNLYDLERAEARLVIEQSTRFEERVHGARIATWLERTAA